MVSSRPISIAAGVTPELGTDPAAFVAAAAAAGWGAAGIWFDPDTWTDVTTRDVKRRLDDTGLTALDMEVVRIGGRDCGEQLVAAAGELGVRNILTVSTFDAASATAERLATLCRHGAQAGIRICVEFMAFTAVKTLADAIEVVTLADEPNAGILVDLLHVHRSGTTYEQIRAADPALFPYAQWCDGREEPDGWETRDLLREALDGRTIPGEGKLDAAQFERLFGATVPFSIEVRSQAMRGRYADPVERASHLLTGTLTALHATETGL